MAAVPNVIIVAGVAIKASEVAVITDLCLHNGAFGVVTCGGQSLNIRCEVSEKGLEEFEAAYDLLVKAWSGKSPKELDRRHGMRCQTDHKKQDQRLMASVLSAAGAQGVTRQ